MGFSSLINESSEGLETKNILLFFFLSPNLLLNKLKKNMVNIQAIVFLDETSTRLFGSQESYLAFCIRGGSTQHVARQRELRQHIATVEREFAQTYNCDPACMKDIILCFGTVEEARIRIRDIHSRHLLCNHSNRVILQIMMRSDKTYNIVSTIFRPHDCETITVDINRPPPLVPEFEP